jgi:hypothetical protein
VRKITKFWWKNSKSEENLKVWWQNLKKLGKNFKNFKNAQFQIKNLQNSYRNCKLKLKF